MKFEFFACHISITLKEEPLSQFKRKSERWQQHLQVNWAGMTLYQFSVSYIFGMKNGIKMIFVTKGFLIPVEYIDSKIKIWHQTHLLVLSHKCGI